MTIRFHSKEGFFQYAFYLLHIFKRPRSEERGLYMIVAISLKNRYNANICCQNIGCFSKSVTSLCDDKRSRRQPQL